MTRLAVPLTVLLACGSALAQGQPKELVGKYSMDSAPEETLELRADGTAAMTDEEMKWSAKAGMLTVGTDVVPYKLSGNKLTLTMGGIAIGWTRSGAAGKGPSALQRAAAKAGKKGEASEEEAEAEAMASAKEWLARNGQGQGAAASPSGRGAAAQPPSATGSGPVGASAIDQQIAQLLLSSAWCSFRYNQTTGTTNTSRAVFSANGLLSLNTGAETYNSGMNGTVAGQYAGGGAMRWRVQGGRLLVDDGSGGGYQDAGMVISRNSSGHPIITADGKEYSACR